MSFLDMIPVIGPIISGIATAAGDAAASKLNYQAVQDTNLQNLKLQEKEWEREDSSIQRKMKDLVAAGLNPVLAAGGSGEPTSLTTKLVAPQIDNNIVGKGVQAALASQQMGRTQADTDIARARARQENYNAEVMEAGLGAQKALAAQKGYVDAAILNNQSLISDYNKMTALNLAKKAEIDANVAAHDWDIINKTGMLSTASGQAGQIENISAMISQVINSIKAKGGLANMFKER